MAKTKGVKKEMTPKKFCGQCKKEKPLNKFYKSTSPVFPDGICSICSDCFSGNIDVENLESVKDGLMQLNLPFLADKWFSTYGKKGNGAFRDYIRQINSLPQYSKLTWKDSIFENEGRDVYTNNNKEENNGVTYSSEWRGSYTQSDLEYLENYYLALQDDFKIVTRNHKDYARKIAKASLAMDRAYDDMLAGMTGADKRYKDLKDAFDQLSKSAQFSENTRGANDVGLGCFGIVFEKVEEKRWVPQHTPLEKDDFDKLIDYFSTINKSLK